MAGLQQATRSDWGPAGILWKSASSTKARRGAGQGLPAGATSSLLPCLRQACVRRLVVALRLPPIPLLGGPRRKALRLSSAFPIMASRVAFRLREAQGPGSSACASATATAAAPPCPRLLLSRPAAAEGDAASARQEPPRAQRRGVRHRALAQGRLRKASPLPKAPGPRALTLPRGSAMAEAAEPQGGAGAGAARREGAVG